MNPFSFYLLQVEDSIVKLNSSRSSAYELFIVIGILLVAIIFSTLYLRKIRIGREEEVKLNGDSQTHEPPSKQVSARRQQKRRNSEQLNTAEPLSNDPQGTRAYMPSSSLGLNTEETGKEALGKTRIKSTPSIATKDKSNRIKFIPSTAFCQSEPWQYPYVSMPLEDAFQINPRKGRRGRIGKTEETFGTYLREYFVGEFKLSTDVNLHAGRTSRFTPDFCLQFEPEGRNILFDIEIDEPYEGKNDLDRKSTHYKGKDTHRDLTFTGRGWIVIRFAEIQVHQNPLGCCKLIAEVVKSIVPSYTIQEILEGAAFPRGVPQWTEVQAQEMSLNRFRETYLGIKSFGSTEEVNIDFEDVNCEDVTLDSPTIEKEVMQAEVQIGEGLIIDTPVHQKSEDELRPPPKEGSPELKQVDHENPIEPTHSHIGHLQQEQSAAVRRRKQLKKDEAKSISPLAPPEKDISKVIEWAIKNNLNLSFTFVAGTAEKICNYEPRYISLNILTGYSYSERRARQFFIPHITSVEVIPRQTNLSP